MSVSRYVAVPRPTESAAISAAGRSARPLPPVELLLDALITAHRSGDRHGVCLSAHRAVRAVLKEVGA
ncbi:MULTISPECIES: hypothetical protein [Streptomyces]|uniref:Uncharacterized protein n=1 Tax=Streptomyces chitinivorans TaxID=1257027 RepID=A0ABW7HUD8_9ACTN|nr:hypothetical protein [Streptomyces chitinivorans]MDH2407193.1 hypothetical protein [Streptomyces chitinivorans]